MSALDLNSIAGAVDNIILAIPAKGTAMAGALHGYGLSLTATLSALVIAYGCIKIMLDGGGLLEIVKDLFGMLLPCGTVMMTMTNYTTWFGHDGMMSQTFNKVTETATAAAGGNSFTPGKEGIKSTLTPFFDAIVTLLVVDKLPEQEGKPDGESKKGTDFLDQVSNIGGAIAEAFTRNVSIVFRFITALVVAGAVLLYMGIVVVGLTMGAIATGLGPIMLPWILFKPLNFMFSGWAKSYLNAKLYILVSSMIMAIMATLPKEMATYTAMMAKQNGKITALGSEFAGLFALMLLSGVLMYVLLQTSSIASGLVGGASINIGALSPGGMAKSSPGGKVPIPSNK